GQVGGRGLGERGGVGWRVGAGVRARGGGGGGGPRGGGSCGRARGRAAARAGLLVERDRPRPAGVAGGGDLGRVVRRVTGGLGAGIAAAGVELAARDRDRFRNAGV